jgi:hypothetical protein
MRAPEQEIALAPQAERRQFRTIPKRALQLFAQIGVSQAYITRIGVCFSDAIETRQRCHLQPQN